MAAASLGAQAQITVDGQITAAEISPTGYQLVGKFTNQRGFGDWGLLSLYAAATSTKVYFFVAGTVEAGATGAGSRNSFQLYIDRPGVAGASATPTALPKPAASPGTSFQNMGAKLDMAPDLALAIKGDGSGASYQAEGAVYTSATAVTDKLLGTVAGSGAPATLSASATAAPFSALAGARMSYRNSSDGKVTSNPGNTTPNTSASYGGAGSFGWEIEVDRTAMGLTAAGTVLQIFALQNNGDGGFLSSDYIPQNTGPLPSSFGSPPNLGTDPDFGLVPGRQTAAVRIDASAAVFLATKAADEAAVAMSVYPNPVAGQSSVLYRVTDRPTDVNVALTDLMGRTVRVLANGVQAPGVQTATVSSADVAAGTYLVRVQVGDKLAIRKVVLL